MRPGLDRGRITKDQYKGPALKRIRKHTCSEPQGRRLAGRFATLIIALIACVTGIPALAEEPRAAHVTTGIRAGDGIIEVFGDFIQPAYDQGGTFSFVNPRFSITDGDENEFNLGAGVRHKLHDRDVILGANAYVDSRNSPNGNRFSQLGAGLEFLSRWVDARVNFYDPLTDDRKIAESMTRDIDTAVMTDVDKSTKTDVSTTTDVSTVPTRGGTLTNTTTTTTTIKTTTTKTTTATTTTTTDRYFERFEAALRGYDAEIGVKLPLAETAPEVRVFVGHYDFESRYGEDIEGAKGRLEVRAGPYLTFDAEVFENDKLNDTDFFVGARLQVPFEGSNPFSGLGQLFKQREARPFVDRMYTDMVMRDVHVQLEESGNREDKSRFQQSSETDTVVDTSTTSETSSNSTTTTTFQPDPDEEECEDCNPRFLQSARGPGLIGAINTVITR